MISYARYLEIKRLLATTGMTHKQIAGQVGVHFNTVKTINRETRPRCRPGTPAPLREPGEKRRRRGPSKFPTGGEGPFVRCPGCGSKVQIPCLSCTIRDLKARDTS
jgi:hypothetical protein